MLFTLVFNEVELSIAQPNRLHINNLLCQVKLTYINGKLLCIKQCIMMLILHHYSIEDNALDKTYIHPVHMHTAAQLCRKIIRYPLSKKSLHPLCKHCFIQ